MADQTAPILMGLPLEVRHTIFKYVAERNIEPRKLLRYWFEKKEVEALIAHEVTANPNAPRPRALYSNSDDHDSYFDYESEAEEDDGDEHSVDQDSEDEDEDEDEMEQEDEAEDDEESEADFLEDQVEAESEGEVDEEAVEGAQQDQSAPVIPHLPVPTSAPTTASAQPAPQGAAIKPHHKWRHVPKFMRLTQCPPPVKLLLTSRQLNNEAKGWFYKVATLHIDATASFAHTTFFEVTFSQIIDAAFSPMENIRRVQVTFVWDSTWIRADTTGCVGAIFPAFLDQRSKFVYQILLKAPDLSEVVIHW